MIFLCYLVGFTLASIYVGIKEVIKRVISFYKSCKLNTKPSMWYK